MLSMFPQLLFLSPFATFLIRIALAAVFGYTAWHRFQKHETLLRIFALADTGIALMLLVGISTQIAALVACLCIIYALVYPHSSPFPRSTLALGLVMAISIVLMGAGPFAFDLPL